MSDAPTTDTPADPFHQLPNAVFRTIIADIYSDVVPPTLTDAELIAERVRAAIAEIASMCPANAEEARIALRVVTADAQARDCIRHARMLFNDPTPAMKCQAQASLMLRTANASRAQLLRVQAARRKREADPATCNQDAWTIHATEGFLLAANGQQVPEPPPRPEPEPPAPPSPTATHQTTQLAEAEHYAILYPNRAAEIRAHGGVPPIARYGPPDAKLILQIVSSASPILQQIDKEYAHTLSG
jgi:hypothetical protein